MLCSSWGCDSVIAARCVTGVKFRKLLPVLTIRLYSFRTCGKVYRACVHLAMFHSSKMWVPNSPELKPCHDWLDLWHQRQRWNTFSLTTTETSVLCSPLLRWHGHVKLVISVTICQLCWSEWSEIVMSAPTFMMSIECCLKMAACWVDSLSWWQRFSGILAHTRIHELQKLGECKISYLSICLTWG